MHERDIPRLEARIAELESRLDRLSAYCEDLEDRIVKLAVAKVSEPRFPYWNWQLGRGAATEERRKLAIAFIALDERARGTPLSEKHRKHIDGIDDELLYGEADLEVRHVIDVIQTITSMSNEAQVLEMFEALQGQGMFRDLCRFVLATPERSDAP